MDNLQLTLLGPLVEQEDERQHTPKYAQVATTVSTYRSGTPGLVTDRFTGNAGSSVMKPNRLVFDAPDPI